MTRHRKMIAFALVCGLCLGSAAFAGSVSGTITFEGEPPKLRQLDMGADPACAKMHSEPMMSRVLVLGDGQTMGNVFVQVKNPPATGHDAPAEPVVMDQKGCIYEPRIAGVLQGQEILFKNSDGILHNVHGQPEKNQEFNIAMPPILKERKHSFNKPEPLFPVKCDVHPWMNAYIAVMTHPFFATTDADGQFTIDGLPPGEYEIQAWHERLGTKTQTVTVDDGSATADFSFSRPDR